MNLNFYVGDEFMYKNFTDEYFNKKNDNYDKKDDFSFDFKEKEYYYDFENQDCEECEYYWQEMKKEKEEPYIDYYKKNNNQEKNNKDNNWKKTDKDNNWKQFDKDNNWKQLEKDDNLKCDDKDYSLEKSDYNNDNFDKPLKKDRYWDKSVEKQYSDKNFKTNCCNKKLDKEIRLVIKALLDELCDLDQDIKKIGNLFNKLVCLLDEKGCLDHKEKKLLKDIKNDINALNCIAKETAKDICELSKLVF